MIKVSKCYSPSFEFACNLVEMFQKIKILSIKFEFCFNLVHKFVDLYF